jgi:DNA-binding transcriptional LysR family regulator
MVTGLEHYRAFYYVAKCGSLTQAAEQLSISQPAVSQSLRQLEATLGTQLFSRTSRGVHLTREGELLYSYVSKGYQQIETGEKKLRPDAQPRYRGTAHRRERHDPAVLSAALSRKIS